MGVENMKNQSVVAGVACFSQLSEPLGAFDRALQVMELLASSGFGLGEVLRDYAHQTHEQMSDLFHASECLLRGDVGEEAVSSLASAYTVLSSAATVLDMTPAAMLRNHTDVIGSREKVSREEIVRITRALKQTPEVMAFLQSEEACHNIVLQALKEKNALAKFPSLAAIRPAA